MQGIRFKAAFITSFAILLGIALSAMYRTFAWEDYQTSVSRSYQVRSRVDSLASKAQIADAAAGRLATAFSQEGVARLRADLDGIQQLAGELRDISAQDSLLAALSMEFNRSLEQELAALGAGISLGSGQALAEAREAWILTGGAARLSAAAENIRQAQAAVLEQTIRRQMVILRRTRWLFGVAGGMSILLLLFTAIRDRREARRLAVIKEVSGVRDEQYRQVVDLAGDIIYCTDSAGRFVFVNQAALSSLHFTESELMGRSYLKVLRQDYRQVAERFYFRQSARRRKNSYLEVPIIDGHGRERWIGQNVQLLSEDGAMGGFQAIAREITERKHADTDLQKSRTFLERIALTTPGLLYVFDLVHKRNVFSNRAIASLLGYREEEFQDRADVLELIHPDDRAAVNAHYHAMIHVQDGEVCRLEYRIQHSDGSWVWLLSRDTPFERDSRGLVRQIVGIAQDVTARRAAQDKLAWQANFDALTGLANRHHFWTRLQHALRRAGLEQSTTSLCVFDIDYFKDINDRFGHAAGDEVLQAIGGIVRTELRSSDVAGRLGGDEFCFALAGTDPHEAARVAERIRERLVTQAFGVDTGAPFSVTATFGIAEWHPHLETKDLMDAADRALYRAKSSGRNRVNIEI